MCNVKAVEAAIQAQCVLCLYMKQLSLQLAVSLSDLHMTAHGMPNLLFINYLKSLWEFIIFHQISHSLSSKNLITCVTYLCSLHTGWTWINFIIQSWWQKFTHMWSSCKPNHQRAYSILCTHSHRMLRSHINCFLLFIIPAIASHGSDYDPEMCKRFALLRITHTITKDI